MDTQIFELHGLNGAHQSFLSPSFSLTGSLSLSLHPSRDRHVLQMKGKNHSRKTWKPKDQREYMFSKNQIQERMWLTISFGPDEQYNIMSNPQCKRVCSTMYLQ